MTGSEPLLRRELSGLEVALADTFWRRLRGRLGKGPMAWDEALLISPCAAVHGWGMRLELDVVFLDADATVIACRRLRPWRCCHAPGATQVLEMRAGAVRRYRIEVGQRLIGLSRTA